MVETNDCLSRVFLVLKFCQVTKEDQSSISILRPTSFQRNFGGQRSGINFLVEKKWWLKFIQFQSNDLSSQKKTQFLNKKNVNFV